MKIRNTVLALAVAALGVTALMSTTSTADAMGGGFSRGGMSSHGGMSRGGFVNRGGFGNRGNFGRFSIRKPIFVPHWHHHRHHVRWHRPLIYGIGAVGIAAPAYAAVATTSAKPCTCLTKEYTQDNLVVFRDLCTKEQAAAPLGGQQQGQAQPGEVEQK